MPGATESLLLTSEGNVARIRFYVRTNSLSPTHSPGQTVFAVSGVVQFVMDHCAHRKRPRITTQECHFSTIQDPHGPLHIVQRPLQVGGLMGHPVQLEVQQGDAW